MRLLINYANHVFRKQQLLNSRTGKEVALFDEVTSYSPADIEPDFFERNRKILSRKRGNGYWLWKPYFIRRSLERLHSGDFLFYCDSGAYFIKPVAPLIDASLETGQDIIIFELPNRERVWTKRDAFVLMDCDSPEYSESNQRLASFSLWKKSRFTMDFLHEYLRYAEDERVITDLENQCGLPDYPGFRGHRHDQSVLSLLTKRHGLIAYRNPSQYGNRLKQRYPNSTYGQLIEHTRGRDNSPVSKVAARIRDLACRIRRTAEGRR